MKYHWVWEEWLNPKKTSQPLQVGDIVHKLFHLQYEGKLKMEDIQHLNKWVQELFPNNEPGETLAVAVQAAELFAGYLVHWQDDPLEVISSEFFLEKDMGDYILWCKVDGLARTEDKRLWRLERKTTSYYDSAFLGGLKASLQSGIYHYLLRENIEEKLSGTYYDLLVKTQIPQYNRSPMPINLKLIKRCLQTVEGVYRDIKRGDFYPSNNCFMYNRECEYIHLCNFDSEETRKSFYELTPEKERR